jgi:hypothetical protein
MTTLKPSAERILRYLRTGRGITAQGARRRFRITNVSARISEIRKTGVEVYLYETPRGRRTYRIPTLTSL